MRRDGRRPDQLRSVRLTPDYIQNPLASVLCEMGNTMVLCTVSEDNSVPRFLKGSGRGWITAEYSMLPGSTDTRNDRESVRGRLSGRTMEIQRLIGRSQRAVANLAALGERTLYIDCDVLQADGGTRCASITGAHVALAIGVERILRRGDLASNPLDDAVAAVSVGVVDGQVVLDLPYEEDSRADVDMNLVATGSGRFVEVQGTGEEATFTPEELAAMTSLGLAGIADLVAAQREAIARAAGAA